MGKFASGRTIVTLASGEIAPDWAGRPLDEKMRSGARTLRNLMVGVYGSVSKRAGLEYIANVWTPPPPPVENDMLNYQSQMIITPTVSLDSEIFL